MGIAETLLKLAEEEIKSHLHVIGGYADKLIAKLNNYLLPLVDGRGVRVPAIKLDNNNVPYHIAKMGIQGAQIDKHDSNGAVRYQSILTACIKSHKRKIIGLKEGDHDFYELELDTTALALIMLYVGPHCTYADPKKTFEDDLKNFKDILKGLVDKVWLDNKAAVRESDMIDEDEARKILDSKGYKFTFNRPLDLFLTDKNDGLDQERGFINEVFQDAYTIAKGLHEKANDLGSVGMSEKADRILTHLRALSKVLKSDSERIKDGMHKGLDTLAIEHIDLYTILNTHRVLPQFLAGETSSARLFRERHPRVDNPPPAGEAAAQPKPSAPPYYGNGLVA